MRTGSSSWQAPVQLQVKCWSKAGASAQTGCTCHSAMEQQSRQGSRHITACRPAVRQKMSSHMQRCHRTTVLLCDALEKTHPPSCSGIWRLGIGGGYVHGSHELNTVWLQVAAVSHSAPTLQKGTLGAPSLLKTTGGRSAPGAAPARSSRQVTHNTGCCVVDWQSFVLLVCCTRWSTCACWPALLPLKKH